MTIYDIRCTCNNLHIQSDIKIYDNAFPPNLIWEGELHELEKNPKMRIIMKHAPVRMFNIEGDGFKSARFYIEYEEPETDMQRLHNMLSGGSNDQLYLAIYHYTAYINIKCIR